MKQNFKKYSLLVFSVVLLANCAKNPENYLEHIEGYWEIDKVTLKDGSTKQYKYNETIDFMSLEDSLKGVRKKLRPNFMGTFETSNSSETFEIKIENDSLNVYYKTPFDAWKETILLATKDQLKVINKNDAIFWYKRYIPLDIN